MPKPTYSDLEARIRELENSLKELQASESHLSLRQGSCQEPADSENQISFEDLFDLNDIQTLQDQFADATGVASLITTPSGEPITKPSNFCRLCKDIIRTNSAGALNCSRSDAEIGKLNLRGPTVKDCLSGGLWDSGAGISIEGRHIANWLMGQVRDESKGEEHIRAYAREIGADEEEAVKAYYEVPSMSKEHYWHISQFLFTLANQLSLLAFQNIQQRRIIADLQNSKDKLRRSEARYQTIIETIPDLVWAKDQNGRFLFCNHAFELLMGEREEDIVGRSDDDFSDRATAEVFRADDMLAAQNDKPSISEEWLTFESNGYYGLYETVKTPLKDDTGQMIGVLGVARDITKIKEKEQELRDIFEMSLDMICIGDLDDARFIKVNPAFSRALGYSEEELLERSFLDFIHPEDLEKTKQSIAEDLKLGKKITKFENRYICKDGSTKWLSWVSHPKIESGLTYAIARDITEERSISKALSESEQRYRTIIESSPMGVHVYELTEDDELIFSGYNEAANKILGINCEKLMGMSFNQAFPTLVDTELPEIYKQVCKVGSSWVSEQVDFRGQDGNGTYEVHAFQTGQNRLTVFFLDISERLTIEREKEILQEKLVQSQKMDAIGQLAGGIAHDFNNMLAGIKGATELLQISLKDNADTLKYIDIINKATDRTSNLIKKLLAFGRKGKQLSTLIDIHVILQDTIAILERSIDKRIELITAFDAGDCKIIGDPAQLQNCFLNLFLNARDAMPGGGTIYVSTRNVDCVREDVSNYDLLEGKLISISIQDTGQGIPSEIKPHIFEPFFTTKETGKGTGLGLAAVYGMIKDHHGSIHCYSEVGHGTNFTIRLPLTFEDGSLMAKPNDRIVRGSGTILLVDDEDIILTTGSLLLKELGYDVIIAENGEQAIQLYMDSRDQIGLIILDMIMPIMDGREAFRKIKTINPDAKIVISSGFAKDLNIADMFEEGLTAFITKPFNSVDLSKVVHDALNKPL